MASLMRKNDIAAVVRATGTTEKRGAIDEMWIIQCFSLDPMWVVDDYIRSMKQINLPLELEFQYVIKLNIEVLNVRGDCSTIAYAPDYEHTLLDEAIKQGVLIKLDDYYAPKPMSAHIARMP